MTVRTEWYQAVRRFFEKYDYFIVPTAQLFPFDVNLHWPQEIAGRRMTTYHEWMKCVLPITMSGCPALAAPAGFSSGGLPIGIQIVAPPARGTLVFAAGFRIRHGHRLVGQATARTAWLTMAADEPFDHRRSPLIWLLGALLLMWCVGMFGRGYWTPDEPREADIAWRMSWQADKAVPLLAGEAFCEKPPLTYWLAALPVRFLGAQAWAARLPNLLYALITALSVGLLATRSAGRFAGWVAAAAVSTFLLSYQVAIWLATDAPLLASVSAALLGAYIGFYAATRDERLRGYLLMHTALGLGFLCKSAVAWMVPALAILTLSIWEKRWRELLRWELYAGLAVQAAMILSWVWFVYAGDDGPAHLKVFFWNNLVGRFAAVDAPPELQYAIGPQEFSGKIPARTADVCVPVDAARHRGGGARMAAAP